MEYIFEVIFIFFISFFTLYYSFHEKDGLPSQWPFVGMLPALLKNRHRINDYFIEVTGKSRLTFHFKGPWFTNMHIIATVDPDNVHHIMSKKFENYPRGSKFYEIFEVIGDGFINVDSTLWLFHRRVSQSFLYHPNFNQFSLKKLAEKVENGLIPVLDHVSKQGMEVDFQDLMVRLTFDNILSLITDYDPLSLSIDMPSVPFFKALDDVEKVIFYRHTVPLCVWKFQRSLGVGQEKKHKEGWKILDTFVYKCIDIKREKLSKKSPVTKIENEVITDLLTLYMEENKKDTPPTNTGDKFLRDTILNFILAGRDTTSVTLSWFFYLLSKNPQVVSNIRKELNEAIPYQGSIPNTKEFYGKLVYLHAALCETLRLYPPAIFLARSPAKPDVLPSGHKVEPHMEIVFNMYAMGRTKWIWGEDCYDFKPERWITRTGKVKHEPSYKFFAFNAGPRTCLGRDMALIQMKAIATAIIRNYNIDHVEEVPVIPDLSIILRMKHGFKVKIAQLH